MIGNPSNGNPDASGSPNSGLALESVSHRKEIFHSLVQLQDQGETVKMSRIRVSVQYTISQDELAGIEREGIQNNWPPL